MENPRKDMEALLNNTAQTAEPFDKFAEREKEIRALSDAAILKSETTEKKAELDYKDKYDKESKEIFSKVEEEEKTKQAGKKIIGEGIKMMEDVYTSGKKEIEKQISIKKAVERSDAETLRREKEIEGLKKLEEEREARKKLLEASREGKNTPPPVPSDSK